jgi:hypothetical protein
MRNALFGAAIVATAVGCAAPTYAQSMFSSPDSGRLFATGGVSNVEGAGGGGISTWAMITGYGTKDSIGGNVHGTFIPLANFQDFGTGASVGLFNRVELSYNHNIFNTGPTGSKLGLGSNYALNQDVYGVKVRLFGDILYDQDTFLPEVSVGMQYKNSDNRSLLKALGSKSGTGEDYYIAASKLFLRESILVNATLRETKANQLGILGFGGPKSNSYQTEFEGSLAYLVTDKLVIGGEYRTMPSNLGFTKSDDWKSIYAAYVFNKNLSLTVAYVDLGTIATLKNQNGAYASVQVGF